MHCIFYLIFLHQIQIIKQIEYIPYDLYQTCWIKLLFVNDDDGEILYSSNSYELESFFLQYNLDNNISKFIYEE